MIVEGCIVFIDGLKRNREAALPYMEKACNQDDGRGCWYLGSIYILGNKFRKKEPEKAMQLFEKSCALDDTFGCIMAHHYYLRADDGVKRDCEKAIKYGEIACNKNIKEICINMTRMYELGECTKVDIKKASEYRRKFDQILHDMQTSGVNLTG